MHHYGTNLHFLSFLLLFAFTNYFFLHVIVLIGDHTCTARRKTTTPTSAWVATKAIHHLRKKTSMGCKELQKTLQDEQKCQIHYDTVWKGRQIALRELYGKWEDSFQLLFNWRADVLKKSPGSVIEIGIKEVEGKFYFHRFFLVQ